MNVTIWEKFRGAENSLRAAMVGAPSARVDREVKITVKQGDLVLGDQSFIGRGSHIAVVGTNDQPAVMTLGARSRIGARCRINVRSSLVIGDDCEFSWLVQILDTDFHTLTYPDGRKSLPVRPVIIGNHVLIGTQATILKGVTIGDGAVIGAGAVVSRDVPARSIVAGNPAEIQGSVASWI